MSPWRIISTIPNGRVSVVCPSARLIEVLREGGGLAVATHNPRLGIYRTRLRDWLASRDLPMLVRAAIAITGRMPLWLAREWEIAKYVRDPHPSKIREGRAEFAAKWVDAKTYGGRSEHDAIMLIWEYTRREGAIPAACAVPEIVRADDLPWAYRAAWRRSHNGGPVWIDDEKARAIDETRMWSQYEERAKWPHQMIPC